MPAASETLPALEQRLIKRRLDFERAEIGRQRGNALSGVEALAAPAAASIPEPS